MSSGWHHLYSQDPQLPEPAAKLLAGAQHIVNFVSGPNDLWVQNVRKLAPEAGLITLSTTPPEDFPGHITEYLLQQLKPAPVIEAALSQMLQSVATRGVGQVPAPAGPVVLHPGAGSGKKCWPVESFLELAQKLRARGRSASVILGEVELERWPKEQIAAFESIAEVQQPASLVELMKVISGASAFAGNDSGPGHLAGILGIPTVSIFGPKSPDRWRPLGPRITTISDPWERIGVDRVLSAILSE
jgi:hypothetical protein